MLKIKILRPLTKLCWSKKDDVFDALTEIKDIKEIQFQFKSKMKLIYSNNDLLFTGKSAGSVKTFSDIDQTIISDVIFNKDKQFKSVNDFLIGSCLQAEIIKYFDVAFSELFDNSSYDTFDLNVYLYGLFELETFDDEWRKTTCQVRDKAYKDNNILFSLMGLRTAYAHWAKDATYGAWIKDSIDRIKKWLDNKVNAQNAWVANVFLMTDKLNSVADVQDLVAQSSGQKNILGTKNVMNLTNPQLSGRSEEQQIFYLRNTAYFFKLCSANLLLETGLEALSKEDKKLSTKEQISKVCYENEEFHRTFLEAEYITNEAMYTGGSVVHVVAGQVKGGNPPRIPNVKSHELAQSFFVNLGTALDHFMEFFKHSENEKNANVKKYFSMEALSKLGKYWRRCKQAVFESKYNNKDCKEFDGQNEVPLVAAAPASVKSFTDLATWADKIIAIKDDDKKSVTKKAEDMIEASPDLGKKLVQAAFFSGGRYFGKPDLKVPVNKNKSVLKNYF